MKKDSKTEETMVSIKAPNIKKGEVWIKGTAPLVMHKFSHKAKEIIKQKQAAGSTANKNKKKEAKNFEECFQESRHISMEGWDGIPAAAFRNACISACRLVGFKMSLAKLSIFIIEDGWDRDEGTPLVKLIGGEPRMLESMVRIGGITKTVDISVRPQWLEWGARLRFKYDADQFTATDVVNLIARVGMQVGICEGRPDSSSSTGMGWGTFEISDEKTVRALEGGAA
jgi:hypothetical protein